MQEYINEYTVANQIMMLREGSKGAIVLISIEDEGRFYESITHKSAVVIPSLRMATDVLSAVTLKGVSGVIAAVQNRFKTGRHEAEFSPDAGDVASLLLNSSKFESVIVNVAGRQWVDAADKVAGGLLKHASTLARNIVEFSTDYNLLIDPAELVRCVSWVDFSIDFAVLSKLLGRCESLKEQAPDNLLFLEGSCSEIALEIISASTHNFKPLGVQCKQGVSKQLLIQLLEVSYDCSDLEQDSFFWKVKAWERKNREYPVFKEWRALDSFKLLWDQRYWENDLSLIQMHDQTIDKLSLVKLDLDNFKNVNEKLGHAAGDDAIRLASKVIKSVMGGAGEVYRRGGDEFVVIIPGCDDAEIDRLAEELRSEIQVSFENWGKDNRIEGPPTASIGIATAPRDASVFDLIKRADEAQKMSKDLGKNRVHRSLGL